MVTEAKRRANNRYNAKNMVQRVVKFSPLERDILDHLDAQENKAGFIKKLIREDMEKGSGAIMSDDTSNEFD